MVLTVIVTFVQMLPSLLTLRNFGCFAKKVIILQILVLHTLIYSCLLKK